MIFWLIILAAMVIGVGWLYYIMSNSRGGGPG